MLELRPGDGEAVYVGLKGFSRYSDRYALTAEEINELAKQKPVYVAFNRIKSPEEIEEAVNKLKGVEGLILNDPGTIWKLREKFGLSITSSVGICPTNRLDLEFLAEIGCDVCVIPPELNEDFAEAGLDPEEKPCKLELFRFALLEMFYKGRCTLTGYFDGVSTKKDGLCTKKCCREWEVFMGDEKVFETSFPPRKSWLRIDGADIVKYEGRQIEKRRNRWRGLR
jgi:putative protease